MKYFLAIDTSSSYMTVLAQGKTLVEQYEENCAGSHSVKLLDRVEQTLEKAEITLSDCDFFAAVTGAGSFTGIRIGIATVKGFCAGTGKPCLPVTSFEVIAYDTDEVSTLAVISAGHGCVYLAGFDAEKRVILPPAYRTLEEAARLAADYAVVAGFEEGLFPGMVQANMARGLRKAVLKKSEETDALRPCAELAALYVRKSQAEENRK